MVLVAFDLDGVLVDSASIVRDAYRWAGVEAPENVLEMEGIDWISEQLDLASELVAVDIKRAKAAHYLDTIHKAKLLPPYHVARDLRRDMYTCVVLSGAPVGAIDRVRRRHAWTWPFVAGMDGVRTTAKQAVLQSMTRDMAPHELAVYVDDQRITVPKPWQLVRYWGQTEEELMKEIKCVFA